MDATSTAKTATLTVGNKTYDFPILSGIVGLGEIRTGGQRHHKPPSIAVARASAASIAAPVGCRKRAAT